MIAEGLELELRAVGMATSVGHDAATACAAIRAGISRPSPIDEQPATNLADHEHAALIGHPVVPLTNGFQGIGRWLQLSRQALADLLRCLELDARGWGRTAIYALLPDLLEPRFEGDAGLELERMAAGFVAPLLAQLRLGLDPHTVELRAHGRTGLASLLVEIDQALRADVERVVVLGVDSYADSVTLMWLADAGRLADDDNPVGLRPGEAGVALCFERASAARERSGWARITRAGATGASNDEIVGSPTGPSSAELFAVLLEPEVVELYTDLNGESWRAHTYGLLLAELPASLTRALALRHVAAEIGDTGEVSALLNLCVAARALQRGYARADASAVAGLSSDGAMVGVRLERSR